MGENSAFASMTGLIDGAMGVERVFRGWEDGVELGFLDIGFVAVDGLQRRVGVNREAVGPKSDDWSVRLVASPELEMAVSFPCVIHGVPVCDLGEERSWIFRQRMEC